MLSKVIGLFALLGLPRLAWACAVCFGDPDSNLTHASTVGILTLLGVTWVVLGAFAAFFVHLKKRSKLASRHEGNGQAMAEDEGGRRQ
ncbi:MAG: hypothetical protein ACE5HZ_09255 [Fidelibacterota bacterium]